MLVQKLFTLASTILLLQWMKILKTQGICTEAPLASRHTHTKLRDSGVSSRGGCSGVASQPLVENQQDQQMSSSQPCKRIQLNICNGRSLWFFPDVEGCDNKEEENACILSRTQTSRTLHLKDKTILANSVITTSSTRRRLLSTWKSVKICTDPEVWKIYLSLMPANLWNIWQDWEPYWNSHYVIKNLHNLSQQHKQPGRGNWSHEHLFTNSHWTSSA